MNYLRIYNELIHNAKHRPRPIVDCELHHILPKSLGGNDESCNLVYLTLREHFVAHLLLCRITTGDGKYKMAHAMARMCKHAKTSRQFALASSAISKGLKGRKQSPEHIAKRTQAAGRTQKGRKRSADTIAKSAIANKGRKHTKEAKANMYANSGRRGKKNTPEHNAKVAIARTGKAQITTPIGIVFLNPQGEQVPLPIGISLAEFARLHNLGSSELSKLINGKYKSHRGWKLYAS